VPLKSGIEALARLEERGVDVTVVTNSLAANNQFAVHGGYAPSRKPLLRAGVEIYEVRGDASFAGQELVAASGAKATLHTKAFVVDRRELFIGSFNFDPRSARINTELGVIIRSPEMAAALDDAVEATLPERAWHVKLDDRGRLRWHGVDADGQPVVYTKEPQTSWWQRFVAGFVRLLPIRSQL
jgi:putative cardiolipin synthase